MIVDRRHALVGTHGIVEFPRALLRTASKKNCLTCSPASEEFAETDEPSLIVARRCFRFIGRESFAVHFLKFSRCVEIQICCLTAQGGFYTPSRIRRRGRVAEGGGLLNRAWPLHHIPPYRVVRGFIGVSYPAPARCTAKSCPILDGPVAIWVAIT
jgi:hypothetical protein